MTVCIALAGIGKIARDAHLPALAASGDFRLAAAVTRHEPPPGVPGFATVGELHAAMPEVSAISICTPPRGRLDLVRQAFEHGLDVMIEKPPAATLSEARHLAELANRTGRVLFVTWHSRAAAGVEPARQWLMGRTVHNATVTWKEDVRVWHPGQHWIWEPGIGVFDPGINALSVISRVLPGPLFVEGAVLRFPANKSAPSAADVRLTNASGLEVSMTMDIDHRGPQTWDVEIHTNTGLLRLTQGGAVLTIDGVARPVPEVAEYEALYRHFAALLARRECDTDLTPFELVADCFLLGRRVERAPLDEL